MDLPILTIVGAFGAQGAGVVSAFTSDTVPAYHIRALTSNASSPAAASLATKPNVTVVQVDLNSVESIREAFKDSTLIFANTYFNASVLMANGAAAVRDLEAQQGLNIVHAASQTKTLKHLIWSTLPDDSSISDGKYNIPRFQSKIPAEKYIRSPESGLEDKSTFIRVGVYGSNIAWPSYRPQYIVCHFSPY